ncbi:DUF3098 domain-containing protein [Marinilongibacter aquaticus]|uniref:DUF3098 domain-containing protein n=1 Tax=Marinilongibacter aquaticus TaxID=2975157 RepID=UPI0021BD8CE8|nr:DUF3098 domain-containing protein [Marinilongibacter aquaticus]UBM59315.1 DUF3098 domain-containing protein [Marinilongibacter aquaticus]
MSKQDKSKKVSEPVQSTDASSALPFGKSNFKFMLIGLAAIVLGFLIMTMDGQEFGFGFLGITLGPIVVFAGFMIELYAILKKKA